MTMLLEGTSTKSSKYWVGKCPCAHPVPTALKSDENALIELFVADEDAWLFNIIDWTNSTLF